MSASGVVLILGAGPRIGAAVSQRFASDGYKVALASRKGTGSKTSDGYLSLKADFSQPSSIPALFEAVEAEFQAPPNIVIYNAGSLTPPPEQNNPLSIPATAVEKDFMINTVSPYVAAGEAVKAWQKTSDQSKKTFIFTGNATNVMIVPMPLMVNVGMGKSASAYWIGTAATLFESQGYRFYYADERHADGRIKGFDLDGAAHGEFYAQLAAHASDAPWHATFVKGKGYTKF